MCTTTFPCILLRVITKNDSGIIVTRRPIPPLTNSNNSKLMKYDLETTRKLSHASYHGFPRRYRSHLTLCVPNNYLQLSVQGYYVRGSNMTYPSLSPVGHSIRICKTSFSIQNKFNRCLASEKKIL